MANRTPPVAIERKTATLAERKSDRHDSLLSYYENRESAMFRKGTGRRPKPYSDNASVTPAVDEKYLRILKNEEAMNALKYLSGKARKRSKQRVQFEDADKNELAQIVASNRERALRLKNPQTPLKLEIESIINNSYASERSSEKNPSRKNSVEPTDSEVFLTQQIRFGEGRENIIAGWQLAAKNNETLPVGQCVYLIHGAGLYKIGHSTDVGHRLMCHRVSSPVPLTLTRAIVCFDGRRADLRVEKCIQKAFRDKRCHGEWFALSDEDLEYLDLSCASWLVKYAEPEKYND